MIKISIDCTKITKARLTKGKYLNVVLIDKPDEYGNDGFVSEDVTKEEREAKVRGNIIGNWKHLGAKKTAAARPAPKQPPHSVINNDPDDIPF